MSQSAPFSSDILRDADDGDAGVDSHAVLVDQFPASYRLNQYDLYAPLAVPELKLIVAELDPRRLHDIIRFLWLAGRPVPPHPLHQQLLMGRDIVVSERIDVHLVWGRGRIFIKPIPPFLLNHHFWTHHLSCRCSESAGDQASSLICSPSKPCERRHLHQCAVGFLISYAALIVHRSDFLIAKEKGLIPDEVTWPRWRRFVRELLHDSRNDSLSVDRLYADVAERFIYGELRLNRLQLIDKVLHGPFSKGFLTVWNSYGSFFQQNSAMIIGGTAYILLVLSAIQVGLGTTRLADDDAFQAASYGFTLFSVLAPLAAFVIMVILFAMAFLYNLAKTRKGEATRARKLGRTWGLPRQNKEQDGSSRRTTVEWTGKYNSTSV
ncbi:hypothetical protein AK830_g1414 [Neonectria ditissima]|uniref:Uncharacterized protein n=1 Tax=Neonectria ditissima TaxID=78410 RepID=A0A0P7BJ44_9HYPO|nr:hypothetical protein AK830_g1414 [Neonectria ditissima]